MTHMPMMLYKGPIFSLIDAHYSHSIDTRMDLLQKLMRGQPYNPNVDPPVIDQLTLQHPFMDYFYSNPPNPHLPDGYTSTPEDRLKALNKNWFGVEQFNSDGSAAAPQLPQSATNTTTGDWWKWYGDAGEIFRQGVIAALEVSLGLPHVAPGESAPSNEQPTRLWPIDVTWTCGIPRFEAYVTWKDLQSYFSDRLQEQTGTTPTFSNQELMTQGSVNLIIHTPGTATPLDQIAKYANNPLSTDDDSGVLAVGHLRTSTQPGTGTDPISVGVGDVRTVQIPLFDGGAAPPWPPAAGMPPW